MRGVPVVWRLKVPLYGEADAGRIWNRTLTKQLVDVQQFVQSAWDPCYFRKVFSDGSHMDMAMLTAEARRSVMSLCFQRPPLSA